MTTIWLSSVSIGFDNLLVHHKTFLFFLKLNKPGISFFIPVCFLEFYAFQNERDDEHLTQIIIRGIPMKAYRIVTDWPIVVLGVMFHILK